MKPIFSGLKSRKFVFKPTDASIPWSRMTKNLRSRYVFCRVLMFSKLLYIGIETSFPDLKSPIYYVFKYKLKKNVLIYTTTLIKISIFNIAFQHNMN